MAMPRSARDAEAVVVWALSVVVAAVFFVAGVQKLVGLQPIGLEAAAMVSFPQWIRIVVGILEIIGAVALLVPATASTAALGLAILMVPATITQLVTGEPGVWVPILLCALLLLIAWRRDVEAVASTYASLRETPHPILREGAIAGVIGATVVALWFLGVDWYAGHPLFTPSTLGHALLGIFGAPAVDDSTFIHVAAYTAFHYAAFMGVGALASLVIHVAGRDPSILIGFVMVFVAVEVAFLAFVALLEQATNLRTLAWYQVTAGNILAAASMGYYLWHAHSELGGEFEHALDDPDEAAHVTGMPVGSYTEQLDNPRARPGSNS
jgi:uncharacterized membrane protein YphA (DoxX/SURF4 family)